MFLEYSGMDVFTRGLAYVGTYLNVSTRKLALSLKMAHSPTTVAEIWGVPFREMMAPESLATLVGVFMLVSPDRREVVIAIRDGEVESLWNVGLQAEALEKEGVFREWIAYQFYPTLPHVSVSLWGYVSCGIGGFLREKLMIFLGGVAVLAIGFIFSFSVQYLLDELIPQGNRTGIFEITIWLACLVVATILFQWVRIVSVVRITMVFRERFSFLLWWRLIHLRLCFFRSFSVGELLYRIQSVEDIFSFLKTSTFTLFFSGLFAVVAFFVLGFFSSDLLIKALFLLGPFLIILSIGMGMQYRYFQDLQIISGRHSAYVLQLVRGVAKIKLANAQDRFYKMWEVLFLEKLAVQYRYRWFKEVQTLFFTMLPMGIVFSLIVYVDTTALVSIISVGAFLFFVLFLTQWAAALGGLFSVFTEAVIPIVVLLRRLHPILREVPEIFSSRTVITDVSGKIEVAGLSFGYSSESLILENIDFQVDPGMFVAIVGPSGCGKSTLLNLLMGFDTPKKGSIFYEDTPLSEIDLTQLRRSFGVVLQDGVLFSGDILSNIIGGLPLGEASAWAAAELAGIAEDIRAMPMGMYTLLMDSGQSLSGGQRQRLMIARALVHQPKVLFLDEATSALDNVTQAKITEGLAAMKLTRIVVAHRLSTIRQADLILVMDQGRIVQRGRYETLIGVEGLFKQLVVRQVM